MPFTIQRSCRAAVAQLCVRPLDHAMTSSMRLILSVVSAGSLSGCIWPVPTTSQRSPEISGRVVDATTQQPIQGALIALHDDTNINAHTDAFGTYRLHATRNVHLVTLLSACSVDYPAGKHYSDRMDVSHPQYIPMAVYAQERRDPQSTNWSTNRQALQLQDITMAPAIRP